MGLPTKHEWSEIILAGLFGGCLALAIGLLWRVGLDKNALFNFLGAMVGAAAVVFLSMGQKEREDRRAEILEKKQIWGYFYAIKFQLDELFGEPFKVSADDPKSQFHFFHVQSIIPHLREFSVQALLHASHQDFVSRAHLQGVIEQCDRTLELAKEICCEADKSNGKPDFVGGRRSIVNLHNSMNLFGSSPEFDASAERRLRRFKAIQPHE